MSILKGAGVQAAAPGQGHVWRLGWEEREGRLLVTTIIHTIVLTPKEAN